jgi:hypothetical protein
VAIDGNLKSLGPDNRPALAYLSSPKFDGDVVMPVAPTSGNCGDLFARRRGQKCRPGQAAHLGSGVDFREQEWDMHVRVRHILIGRSIRLDGFIHSRNAATALANNSLVLSAMAVLPGASGNQAPKAPSSPLIRAI